jgi:hypothetical protein
MSSTLQHRHESPTAAIPVRCYPQLCLTVACDVVEAGTLAYDPCAVTVPLVELGDEPDGQPNGAPSLASVRISSPSWVRLTRHVPCKPAFTLP